MSLENSIRREFQKKIDRNWDTIYWMIDFHDTIIPGMYKLDDGDSEFYPYAVEALQELTKREDVCLILWTSSHEHYLEKHLNRMKDLGIEFKYFNKNPECETSELCNFDDKFYFNVILDDKAGFDGTEDWEMIKNLLEEINV